MIELKDGKEAIYFQNRDDWRTWLYENSQTKASIWLILYHKKSKVECVNLNDATEEALCFGWIDSLCKKRDFESYYLTFSKRNVKKSNWSKPNIERAERMIEKGLMTEYGLLTIEIAKSKGKWINV